MPPFEEFSLAKKQFAVTLLPHVRYGAIDRHGMHVDDPHDACQALSGNNGLLELRGSTHSLTLAFVNMSAEGSSQCWQDWGSRRMTASCNSVPEAVGQP